MSVKNNAKKNTEAKKSTPPKNQPELGPQVADAPKGQTTAKPANMRLPLINDVRLSGRLAADPLVRDVNGRKVANFQIASERPYRDAQDQWQKKVAWVPCAAWGFNADRAKGMKKGDPVYVEGRLATDQWQDKEGGKRSMSKLEIFKIQPLNRTQAVENQQSMSR